MSFVKLHSGAEVTQNWGVGQFAFYKVYFTSMMFKAKDFTTAGTALKGLYNLLF